MINGEFSLTCSAEGFPRPSIIWFMNNTMISSGVSDVNTSMTITSTLTISNANFNDSGMYYCQAESSEFTNLNVTSGVGIITVVGKLSFTNVVHTCAHTRTHTHTSHTQMPDNSEGLWAPGSCDKIGGEFYGQVEIIAVEV